MLILVLVLVIEPEIGGRKSEVSDPKALHSELVVILMRANPSPKKMCQFRRNDPQLDNGRRLWTDHCLDLIGLNLNEG